MKEARCGRSVNFSAECQISGLRRLTHMSSQRPVGMLPILVAFPYILSLAENGSSWALLLCHWGLIPVESDVRDDAPRDNRSATAGADVSAR